jgi:hypothetical protein
MHIEEYLVPSLSKSTEFSKSTKGAEANCSGVIGSPVPVFSVGTEEYCEKYVSMFGLSTED